MIRWSVKNTEEETVGVRIQSGLDLSEFDSRPEPDIAWVKAGRYSDRHPIATDVLLLVEVSDSSLRFDMVAKAELYAKAGIGEYWIVDVASQEVRVHRQPNQDRYTQISTFGDADKISPQVRQDASLDLAKLFATECGRGYESQYGWLDLKGLVASSTTALAGRRT